MRGAEGTDETLDQRDGILQRRIRGIRVLPARQPTAYTRFAQYPGRRLVCAIAATSTCGTSLYTMRYGKDLIKKERSSRPLRS